MKIRKAYRFRLKTTPLIEEKFDQFAGCARKLWNMVLAISLRRLEARQPIFWYNEAAFWLTLWKSSDEYGFFKACHSQVLQQKLKDLDKAFRDAFDKNQPLKKLPTWRKRNQHGSFRFPQGFKLENRRVYLPKIGWVGFFKSCDIEGTPKNATISKQGPHWFLSIQVEIEKAVANHPATSAIGIDLGVKRFAALSNGSAIGPINAFKAVEIKLAKEQRKLSRKEKFSCNWKKQKKRVQMIHSCIARSRRDFLHKTSTQLSNNHALIVVEELKIRNMSKSARGDREKPGHRVKAKSGLNKSILDQGWGEFKRQLEYKQTWRGGLLLSVNPQHTSQCCHACGHIAKENRVSQADFYCQQCGHKDNADTNAAKNILAAGHAVLACGEWVQLGRSKKQEPPRNCEKVAA